MKYSVEAKQSDPVMTFVMHLLHSATNAHIQHWTTRSFAAHEALGFFYEKMPVLLDDFVETFQGKYGLLHDFVADYKLPAEYPIDYLQSLSEEVATLRREKRFPQDSELQNEVDNIANLINKTLYKLRYLK